MNKIAIFMANGCEEIEGLTVVDNLRRVGLDIVMVSITGSKTVVGSHNITFEADEIFEDVNFDEFNGIVLPGGMPGTLHLGAHAGVTDLVKSFAKDGKLVSAICAAPSVLGECGILHEKKATSYPGFEEKLIGAISSTDDVVVDGNIITSRGMGTAIDFSLAIIAYYMDEAVADDLAKKIIYR